jgi:hypothetical protein
MIRVRRTQAQVKDTGAKVLNFITFCSLFGRLPREAALVSHAVQVISAKR